MDIDQFPATFIPDIKLLIYAYALTDADVILREILFSDEGDIYPVKWILREGLYNGDDGDDGYPVPNAPQWACRRRCPGFAKWLAGKFPLAFPLCDSNLAFRLSCAYDYLEMAKWLAAKFRITSDDVRADDNYALFYSCQYGHLEVVEWLVDEFELTSEDVRDDSVFKWVCHNGHLSIAKLLAAKFSLTVEDARADSDFAFKNACMNGHLDVAKWLVAEFKFTAEDVRSAIGLRPMMYIYSKNHRYVLEWLESEFDLTLPPE